MRVSVVRDGHACGAEGRRLHLVQVLWNQAVERLSGDHAHRRPRGEGFELCDVPEGQRTTFSLCYLPTPFRHVNNKCAPIWSMTPRGTLVTWVALDVFVVVVSRPDLSGAFVQEVMLVHGTALVGGVTQEVLLWNQNEDKIDQCITNLTKERFRYPISWK